MILVGIIGKPLSDVAGSEISSTVKFIESIYGPSDSGQYSVVVNKNVYTTTDIYINYRYLQENDDCHNSVLKLDLILDTVDYYLKNASNFKCQDSIKTKKYNGSKSGLNEVVLLYINNSIPDIHQFQINYMIELLKLKSVKCTVIPYKDYLNYLNPKFENIIPTEQDQIIDKEITRTAYIIGGLEDKEKYRQVYEDLCKKGILVLDSPYYRIQNLDCLQSTMKLRITTITDILIYLADEIHIINRNSAELNDRKKSFDKQKVTYYNDEENNTNG